jgi:hypothetical protein
LRTRTLACIELIHCGRCPDQNSASLPDPAFVIGLHRPPPYLVSQ